MIAKPVFFLEQSYPDDLWLAWRSAWRARGRDTRQTQTEFQLKLMTEMFAEHFQLLRMVMGEGLFGTSQNQGTEDVLTPFS